MKQLINFLIFTVIAFTFFSCKKETDSMEEAPIIEAPIIQNKLPQIFINTNGTEIVDEPKINAEMTIRINDEVDYEGAIAIEIRGSSSQIFPKKQFGFETRDASNEDVNVSLLGLPEEEDWILNAPFSDKSLMRNKLIYDLSNDIGRYASRSKFVDVTINESYNGVYLLLEKLKRDDNRIDINKLKDDENEGEDLTGGYILKIDKADQYTNENSIESQHAPNNTSFGQKIYFLYDTPDEEDITTEQKNYISDYLSSFENALSGDNFTDPNIGYRAYIDTQSFIEFFLLNELSNNVDGYRISTWLVKDKNEKLKMGPIWDFNLAFGNADYCSGGETNVWAYKFNERCSGDFWLTPFWWERLLEDPAFVIQLKRRWEALRTNEFSNTAILQKIDNYQEALNASNSITENFEKWPILDQYVWPNNFIGSTYDQEKDYFVNWITDRLSWLDTEISRL